MQTDKFYLDECGCYTADIKKAKALICSKGIFVKPKCLVNRDLKIVSEVKDAVAVVNAYTDGYLQIVCFQSGGHVSRRAYLEKMCENTVNSYPKSYGLIPLCPTNKTCLLANFMEKRPRIRSCHTLTDIVDRNGKVVIAQTYHSQPMSPEVSGVKRSTRIIPHTESVGTKPYLGKQIEVSDDNFIRSQSHPAFLITLEMFEKINPGIDFLRDYLYFCE